MSITYLRERRLKIFCEFEGFIDFAVLQVVDHQVQSGFGHHIQKRWKHLTVRIHVQTDRINSHVKERALECQS